MRISFASIATALALSGFAFALISPSAYAQTNYGPGTGGSLIDATSAADGEFYSSILISGTGATVASVNSVTVTNLVHSYIGDLGIYLLNEDSNVFVALTEPPAGASANFNGTYTFLVNPTLQTVDQAVAGLGTTANLASGSYAISEFGGGTAIGPRTNFTPFNGLALDGTWTLAIIDYASGDTGTLGSWSFNVTPVAVTVPEAGTLAFALPALGMIGTVAVIRRRKK